MNDLEKCPDCDGGLKEDPDGYKYCPACGWDEEHDEDDEEGVILI